MATKSKDIVYADYPMVKETNKQGGIKMYYNSDALAQAIKIWMVSSKGEKIRTTGGGYLMPFIGKTLDWEHAQQIAQRLITGLAEDFQPPITVTDIQVVPDTDNFRWIVSVKGYNADLNVGVNTLVVVSNI